MSAVADIASAALGDFGAIAESQPVSTPIVAPVEQASPSGLRPAQDLGLSHGYGHHHWNQPSYGYNSYGHHNHGGHGYGYDGYGGYGHQYNSYHHYAPDNYWDTGYYGGRTSPTHYGGYGGGYGMGYGGYSNYALPSNNYYGAHSNWW